MTSFYFRDLELSDLEDYFVWNHPSREFHTFNGPYFQKDTEDELQWKIEDYRISLKSWKSHVLWQKEIIADKGTNKIIGEVNWYWKSEETLWMEVWIVIFNEQYWGQWLGTIILKDWITKIFYENPQIIRLWLSTWSGNIWMIRVAEKLWLIQEANYRKARIVDGNYYNSLSYGILREEWEDLHLIRNS